MSESQNNRRTSDGSSRRSSGQRRSSRSRTSPNTSGKKRKRRRKKRSVNGRIGKVMLIVAVIIGFGNGCMRAYGAYGIYFIGSRSGKKS